DGTTTVAVHLHLLRASGSRPLPAVQSPTGSSRSVTASPYRSNRLRHCGPYASPTSARSSSTWRRPFRCGSLMPPPACCLMRSSCLFPAPQYSRCHLLITERVNQHADTFVTAGAIRVIVPGAEG